MGTQAGLDVADGNVLIKGRERAAERGRGVALDDHHAGAQRSEHRLQAAENARRRLRQRLSRLHQIQIVVWDDFEHRQHLIEHLAMLGGDADANVERVVVGAQIVHQRAKFDGLRTGAEDETDFMHDAKGLADAETVFICGDK